jgi:hypothetical protein
MFQYYNELLDEEKEDLTEVIKILQSQTYLLEKKYDSKAERYVASKTYRNCERHLDFLKAYFQVADMELIENRQYGIMFLKTRNLQGDKLSKLTTVFILLLKLVFDEQMNTATNSIHVYTTLDEIYEKIKLFRLWDNRSISMTEVRKTLSSLKKYQIIEIMDEMGELEGSTRFIIYPTVNLLFDGQSLEGIIEQYQVEEEDADDEQISGNDENMFE